MTSAVHKSRAAEQTRLLLVVSRTEAVRFDSSKHRPKYELGQKSE